MKESKASCFRCGGSGYVFDDSGPPEYSTSRVSCPVCNMSHHNDVPARPVRLLTVADIVEGNGRTIRENNMAVGHNIPVGTLVEVKYDKWHGGGACSKVHARLFVLGHDRDCDGTPLYSLGYNQSGFADTNRQNPLVARVMHGLETGFAEDALTPVEVDDRLCEGHGSLEWDA